MEVVHLKDIWRANLIKDGWSDRAAHQMSYRLATSKLGLYNRMLGKLKVFCDSMDCDFPPSNEANLVECLCTIANNSVRPKSQLNCAVAAVSKLYKALNLCNVTASDSVKLHN